MFVFFVFSERKKGKVSGCDDYITTLNNAEQITSHVGTGESHDEGDCPKGREASCQTHDGAAAGWNVTVVLKSMRVLKPSPALYDCVEGNFVGGSCLDVEAELVMG